MSVSAESTRLRDRADHINDSWWRRGGLGRVTAEDVRAIEERDGGQCVFCGEPTTAVDHDVPVARGGLNERRNLQLCCRPCNRRKSAQTGAEFRGLVPSFCPKGHARTPENRWISGRGWSFCRPCMADNPKRKAAQRRYEAKRKSDPVLRERRAEYARARRQGRTAVAQLEQREMARWRDTDVEVVG